MQENIITKDVAIIGAGPVGIFTIFELGMLKINAVVIDALATIGGQCSALYPEKPIYDIPAFSEITGEELILNLKKQSDPFKPSYLLNQQVISVKKEGEVFIVRTSADNIIHCRAVIIAGGAGSFGPNRPPISNIEKYENKSVFYYVNEREKYRGKNIVIAGGGDSAIDWAINLSDIANKIYVVHRRNKFRCAPDSYQKLNNIVQNSDKIEMVIPYQLHDIIGIEDRISNVVVKDLQGEYKELKADYLLPFFGLAMELGPIKEWGLNFNKLHIEVTQNNMQTNIPGIYAIGDIATYQSKLKLILTGFAEAATAAHDIYHLVYPYQALHFQYSTTKGVTEA
jgi:thioredoxin reductase (NADPH)